MENSSANHKLSPKFFFVSLGALVTLIASVTSFLNLVFATLDKHFPDALNATYQYGYNTYSYEGMRTALATLIIVFPAFLILSSVWTRMVTNGLGSIEAVIKKWMLYLVIFLASVVVIVDLVTLVRYFVSGEITVRFILKVLVTLVTAALAGFYYFKELDTAKLAKWVRPLSTATATVLVLVAIILSFTVMGSPMAQRKLRLDDRRVQDLQSIQYQVINFWQQKEKLPATLDELSTPISSYTIPPDPEFQKGLKYEYRKTGALSFELCATFSLPMPEGWQEYSRGDVMPMYAGGSAEDGVSVSKPFPSGVNDSWDHEGSRTCYPRTIDPDIYPPYPKPTR